LKQILFLVTFTLAGWEVNAQIEAPPAEHPNALEDSRDRIYYPGDTESVKPLLWKLGGNVLLDQKEIWTSPFHMHAEDAK